VTKKSLLSLLAVLTIVFLTVLTAYPCGNNSHNGKEAFCPKAMKDVKIEATNIANGVTVKITSDNPEVVKQIQEHKANCQHNGMKNSKVEVTNIANGVTIKITSDDPEVVKQIQEHRANCQKNGHKEGSKECQEAHKSGKCLGH